MNSESSRSPKTLPAPDIQGIPTAAVVDSVEDPMSEGAKEISWMTLSSPVQRKKRPTSQNSPIERCVCRDCGRDLLKASMYRHKSVCKKSLVLGVKKELHQVVIPEEERTVTTLNTVVNVGGKYENVTLKLLIPRSTSIKFVQGNGTGLTPVTNSSALGVLSATTSSKSALTTSFSTRFLGGSVPSTSVAAVGKSSKVKHPTGMTVRKLLQARPSQPVPLKAADLQHPPKDIPLLGKTDEPSRTGITNASATTPSDLLATSPIAIAPVAATDVRTPKMDPSGKLVKIAAKPKLVVRPLGNLPVSTSIQVKGQRKRPFPGSSSWKFPCSNCSQEFSREDDRRRHVIEHHEKKNLLACQGCLRPMLKRSLNRHQQTCRAMQNLRLAAVMALQNTVAANPVPISSSTTVPTGVFVSGPLVPVINPIAPFVVFPPPKVFLHSTNQLKENNSQSMPIVPKGAEEDTTSKTDGLKRKSEEWDQEAAPVCLAPVEKKEEPAIPVASMVATPVASMGATPVAIKIEEDGQERTIQVPKKRISDFLNSPAFAQCAKSQRIRFWAD
ncbi:hypothetical protein BV898_16407 [Hypsibius exemplaris]|uniref:C2H2-type domain-containing protein n=1 Tax=Hypsibius exemplaris TaxID=2072580 RepID=A0A9X6NDD3_HYPEX|nr:hypothetical protein BV898_16407 [Hypsibius exemplaris]